MFASAARRPGQGLVWVFVLLAFLAGALGMYVLQPRLRDLFEREPAPPAAAEAEPPRRVTALGRLEPEGGVIDLAGPPGDRIAEILVQPGSPVKAGQPLVRLASYEAYEQELAQIRIRRAEAKRRRKSAQEYTDIQVRLAENRIEQLTRQAESEESVQGQRIAGLEEQLKEAVSRLETYRSLKDKPAIRQAELEVDKLKRELSIAREVLAQARETALQGLKAARLQVEAAEKERDRLLSEIPSDEVLAAQERLAEIRLRSAELRAPSDGLVLRIFAAEGEPVTAAGPVLQMADVGRMVAKAEVYETDVPLVRDWLAKGGARATVTGPVLEKAAPGGKLTGKVERVGTVIGPNQVMPLNPVEDVDRRVIDVWVRLDDNEVASKYINMQVTVHLEPVE